MSNNHRFRIDLTQIRSPRGMAIAGLALITVIGVFSSTASTIADPSLSHHTKVNSLLSAVITAGIGYAAFFGIPRNQKQVARDRIDDAVAIYPIIQNAEVSQRNDWCKQIRHPISSTRYMPEEIDDMLMSGVEGQRLVALVAAQWQWPDTDGHQALNTPPLELNEKRPRKGESSTKYLPRLLELLVKPHRAFEHYQVVRAVWGMFNHLDKDQREAVRKSCDAVPENVCEKWRPFTDYVISGMARQPART